MRTLIIRIGAFGDAVVTTPLVRHLHQKGHEIYYLCSERGEEILRNNPYISKTIVHKKNSVENSKLSEHFKQVAADNACDCVIDLCESIERNIVVDISSPRYNYTKPERKAICDVNYYEQTGRIADKVIPGVSDYSDLLPEMFFTKDEENDADIEDIRKQCFGKNIVMLGLSGSSISRSYPAMPLLAEHIAAHVKNVKFVTVGDEACQILECSFSDEATFKRSGIWTMRQSALMAKHSQLVISPDTGFLHTAGCFDIPKVCLFTNSTHENISKHFKNAYAFQSVAYCSPCFRTINNHFIECKIDEKSNGCICMSLENMDFIKIGVQCAKILRGE
jgi:ADP-heptose:LPS heptosyltransferase